MLVNSFGHAAELSALYRAPNEPLARQRHGTYKVGLKVLVLAQRDDTLLSPRTLVLVLWHAALTPNNSK